MIYYENNDIQEFANDTVIGYLCENIKRQDEYIKENAIKGDKGDKGDKGEDGADGANAYYAVGKFKFTWEVEVGGHFGVNISNFNIAPKQGDKFFIFVEDTVSDWVCWCEANTVTETNVNCNVLSMQDIKGLKGDKGDKGDKGENGHDANFSTTSLSIGSLPNRLKLSGTSTFAYLNFELIGGGKTYAIYYMPIYISGSDSGIGEHNVVSAVDGKNLKIYPLYIYYKIYSNREIEFISYIMTNNEGNSISSTVTKVTPKRAITA